MSENRTGYISMPTSIFYETKICSAAKILYAEITALSNQKGYCWASNKYFADLHKVDIKTVKRWIKSLVNSKYISSTFYTPDEDGKAIKRCLKLACVETKAADVFDSNEAKSKPPQATKSIDTNEDKIVPDNFSLSPTPQKTSEDASFFCPASDKKVTCEGTFLSTEGDSFVHNNNLNNNINYNPSVRHNSGAEIDRKSDENKFLKECIQTKLEGLSAESKNEIQEPLLAAVDELLKHPTLKINKSEHSTREIMSAILDLFRKDDDGGAIIMCYCKVRKANPKNRFLYLITTLFNCVKEI